MKRRALRALTAVVVSAVIFLGVPSAPAATGAIPYLWKNCTHVHTKYPHESAGLARGTGPPACP
jgi:hypothetical protein